VKRSLTVLATALACAQPIPNLESLLKEVQANQHRMDEIRENYTFHRTITEEDLGEKGAYRRWTMDADVQRPACPRTDRGEEFPSERSHEELRFQEVQRRRVAANQPAREIVLTNPRPYGPGL
jgi:hypothetical protein